MQAQMSMIPASGTAVAQRPIRRFDDPVDNLTRLLKLLDQAREVETSVLYRQARRYSPYRALLEAVLDHSPAADCA